jgi:thiol-disulfide isomerase/thioredoxin
MHTLLKSTIRTSAWFFGIMLLLGTQAFAGEFPDEWFIRDGNRPASLKNIEGKPAPELQLDAWIGEETSLQKLRGKVVVVDFWATWCGPCMQAIPKNIEMVNNYGDQGLVFLGVHDNKSGWDRADGVVQDKSINYPVARLGNGGASTRDYGVAFWPTYVAIDRNGVIRAAGLKPSKVGDVVKVLLAEGGPAMSSGGGEFPADYFTAGASRMPSLARMEGKKAPAIKAGKWIGEKVTSEQRDGRVTVIRFISPDSTATQTRLPAWSKVAKELSRQGVLFVGVCDHLADWKQMQKMMGEEKPAFAVALDAAPDPEKTLPLGATAIAYGVRGWPTTIVIDRKGTVRAAGLQDAKLRTVIDKLMAESMDEGTKSR